MIILKQHFSQIRAELLPSWSSFSIVLVKTWEGHGWTSVLSARRVWWASAISTLATAPSKVRGSISHGKWSIEIDGLPINSMVDLSMAMLVITRG